MIFIFKVLFQNSVLQQSEPSCVHMWLFLFDSINDIDFPLNAKIAQFSFNCGLGFKGCLLEAVVLVFF